MSPRQRQELGIIPKGLGGQHDHPPPAPGGHPRTPRPTLRKQRPWWDDPKHRKPIGKPFPKGYRKEDKLAPWYVARFRKYDPQWNQTLRAQVAHIWDDGNGGFQWNNGTPLFLWPSTATQNLQWFMETWDPAWRPTNTISQGPGYQRSQPPGLLCTLILFLLCCGELGRVDGAPQGLHPLASGHTLSGHEAAFAAYDCDHPTSIESLRLPPGCRADAPEELGIGGRVNYQLLQRTQYFTYKAVQCVMHSTETTYSCNWASHLTMAAAPKTHHYLQVPAEICAEALITGKFRGVDDEMHDLVFGGAINYIPFTPVGTAEISHGYPSCTGEALRTKHGRMESALRFTELQFSLQEVNVKEHFDTGRIHVIGTGAEFEGAEVVQNSLISNTFGTFYLHGRPDQVPCQYQVAKTFQAHDNLKAASPVLVDKEAQIHIELGPHASPEGCAAVSGGYWQAVNHPQMLLAKLGQEKTSDLEPLEDSKLDIAAYVDLKAEWGIYLAQDRLMDLDMTTSRCESIRARLRDDLPVGGLLRQPEKLIINYGELLYLLSCRKTTVKVATDGTENCYKFLPVLQQPPTGPPVHKFLVPYSRLLVNHSEPLSCEVAARSPHAYRALTGEFVAANGQYVHAVPNPGILDLEGDTYTVDTAAKDSGGGGFTPEQGAKFSASYAWPLYNRATASYKAMLSGNLQRGELWQASLSADGRRDYFRALKNSIPKFSLWAFVRDEILPFFTIVGSICSTAFAIITIAFGTSLLLKYLRLTRAGIIAGNIATLGKIICCQPLSLLADPAFEALRSEEPQRPGKRGPPDDDQPDDGDPRSGAPAGGGGGDPEWCPASTVATTSAGYPTAPPDPLYAGIPTSRHPSLEDFTRDNLTPRPETPLPRMMSQMSSLLHLNKRLAKEAQLGGQ